MSKFAKTPILAALLAAAPSLALAQEDPPLTWTAALTSEYMFRGVSQTDDKPALQGSLTYTFGSGWYVGGWASNVDFGDETDAEFDTYVGWNGDLDEALNLDVQLVRYNYVGEPDGVDYAYNELVGKLVLSETYSATLAFTNDFLNVSENSFYYAVGGEWDVTESIGFGAGVGYTTVSGPGEGYLDYSLGLDRDFGPVNVLIGYVGSDSGAENNFGRDNTEDKFMLTFSIEG